MPAYAEALTAPPPSTPRQLTHAVVIEDFDLLQLFLIHLQRH